MLVVTCLDHRVDPAIVLGLQLGDAPVIRNAGGRVTQAVIDDIAYLAFLAEQAVRRRSSTTTGCSKWPSSTTPNAAPVSWPTPTSGSEAAAVTGVAEATLEAEAVADPHVTVKADVERLLVLTAAAHRR